MGNLAEEMKAKLEVQHRQTQNLRRSAPWPGDGIAHAFNNLLMGIQGRSSLISSDLETSHPHSEHVHAIEEYIRSATNPYQAWTYNLFKAKTTTEDLAYDDAY